LFIKANTGITLQYFLVASTFII